MSLVGVVLLSEDKGAEVGASLGTAHIHSLVSDSLEVLGGPSSALSLMEGWIRWVGGSRLVRDGDTSNLHVPAVAVSIVDMS